MTSAVERTFSQIITPAVQEYGQTLPLLTETYGQLETAINQWDPTSPKTVLSPEILDTMKAAVDRYMEFRAAREKATKLVELINTTRRLCIRPPVDYETVGLSGFNVTLLKDITKTKDQIVSHLEILANKVHMLSGSLDRLSKTAATHLNTSLSTCTWPPAPAASPLDNVNRALGGTMNGLGLQKVYLDSAILARKVELMTCPPSPSSKPQPAPRADGQQTAPEKELEALQTLLETVEPWTKA